MRCHSPIYSSTLIILGAQLKNIFVKSFGRFCTLLPTISPILKEPLLNSIVHHIFLTGQIPDFLLTAAVLAATATLSEIICTPLLFYCRRK